MKFIIKIIFCFLLTQSNTISKQKLVGRMNLTEIHWIIQNGEWKKMLMEGK